MNIQILKNNKGKPEFLVIPIEGLEVDYDMAERELVEAVENAVDNLYADLVEDEPVVDFKLSDYIGNPVKIMRIEAGLTQKDLAVLLSCSQANVSQIENLEKVSEQMVSRVKSVVSNL
ncbi:MAG: helix-turn-helix transcriptional regulator [Candidatus Marinimicrobia bacterium]|nr:helix-turn-helix transcriptional regulator [Candidatus Neomarinimicrobiota bacterium]MCH8068686.1 helix-turn-helix transcriptional regulator [Candidatus Neomarinimicrobiota bacterium]